MIHLHLIYEVGNLADIIACILWALACPFAALVGWGIYRYNKDYNDDESLGYTIGGMSHRFKNMRAGFMLMLLTGIASPFVGYAVIASYVHVIDKFNNKKYKTIEGRVTNSKKPSSDSFTVDTVYFRYGGGNLCYNKTQDEGSVIRNGLYVRILYVETYDGKEIWRLETE
jgi:hypothetical protein